MEVMKDCQYYGTGACDEKCEGCDDYTLIDDYDESEDEIDLDIDGDDEEELADDDSDEEYICPNCGEDLEYCECDDPDTTV